MCVCRLYISKEVLRLSGNGMRSTLPTEVGHIRNLSELKGFSAWLIGFSSNVAFLEVDQNRFTGQLPVELGGLTRLEHLDLSRNRFTGTLPPEFGNLTCLGKSLGQILFTILVSS